MLIISHFIQVEISDVLNEDVNCIIFCIVVY